TVTLGCFFMAVYVRLTRASMLEVIGMDFVKTARAKGVSPSRVIRAHVLRNALLPIITLLGFELPGLFSGAIITEKVFNWPGAGHIHIDSLAARDYPVLMGFTLFLAVLTIVGNLLADVLYAWADPRIRVRS
ncbi:MAG: ABC transporter permease, partial [Klebsiella sp.]|nr:ABC transporter permease [Klebsiella sp.]